MFNSFRLFSVFFGFFNLKLDAGIHPAYSGLSSLPFFDEIDPASIDILLVTQYVKEFLLWIE